jgi:hypothetical protein
MKKILEFDTDQSYDEWQDKVGNSIFCLEDFYGNYLGDIREEDLVKMWNTEKLISIENPCGIFEETLASLANSKCQNYVVLPLWVEEAKELVVEIRIIKKD